MEVHAAARTDALLRTSAERTPRGDAIERQAAEPCTSVRPRMSALTPERQVMVR